MSELLYPSLIADEVEPEMTLRILILCYDFPPYPSVGARRPYYWYKILPEFGHHPVVITRNWNQKEWNSKSYYTADEVSKEVTETADSTLIKVPLGKRLKNKVFKSNASIVAPFRKLWTAFDLFTRWDGRLKDDYHFLYEEAQHYLKSNKVDYIIATGEPFLLFKHAAALSSEFSIPWIPDYRDGWSTNHSKSGLKTGKLKRLARLEKEAEGQLLQSAAFFTTVNNKVKAQNESLLPAVKGAVIGNGIDYEQYKTSVEQDKKTFHILYTGHLYPKHDVKRFLDGYEAFLAEHPDADIEVSFVGITLRPCIHLDYIKRLVLMYPDKVNIVEPLEHDQIVKLQKKAGMLLKFNFMPQAEGFLGAKMYEYAASRRPILTIPTDQDRSTTFFPDRDIQTIALTAEEVKESIKNWYSTFKKSGTTKTSLTDKELYNLSSQAQVEELAKLLVKNSVGGSTA